MERAIIAAVVFTIGTVLATPALAQGRHDERPHGSTRASAPVDDAID
jgi:hypothetical protein